MKDYELWHEYCQEKNIDEKTPYEAWAFCGGGPFADSLLKLVLEGKKFGTASLYEAYLQENEEIPSDDCYNVLLDARENAICVVKNYDVRVEEFFRASEFHGYSEGEEERNLEAWRRIHKEFFSPDFENLRIKNVADCHAVLEKFTLEYVASDYKGTHIEPEEFYFVEPSIKYASEITAYRNEMIQANSSMDGCLSLGRMPNPKEFVDYAYEWGNPLRELKENGIRGTELFCVRKVDKKIIGMIQVRAMKPTHPKAYMGHIGYSVAPSERGHGYATYMLRKALEYLKYGLGIPVAELSALSTNKESIRVIEKNGGVYRDTITTLDGGETLNRYTIDLREV